MATKKKPVKAKVKAKVKSTKAKVKGKVKALLARVGLAVLFAGCSTATPASRATTAQYEITFSFDDGAKGNTVNLTLGDGALASADSSGSTETQTATPTLDVKPDVNLNYAQGGGITNRGTGGGTATGAAGVLEKLLGSLTDEGLAALTSAIASKEKTTVTLAKKDGTTTTATCENGTCTFSDGTTATAADCENCTAK